MIEPKEIMSIIVILIILASGTFAFFTISGSIDIDESKTISVTDDTQDQTTTIPSISTIVRVRKYNVTDGWSDVPSAGYTLDGNTLTIHKEYI